MRADDGFAALGGVLEKVIDLGNRAVEGHHGVAMVIHVEDQVLAHDCQTDQRDICRLLHDLAPERSLWVRLW